MAHPTAYGLPHREPFIFIGAVLTVTPGTSAVCVKTFAADEPFFRGHFPGDPLVPGVLLTEALAQTAGIAAGEPGAETAFRLSAIRQMKFLRAVRPGEEVRLTAEKSGGMGGLFQFHCAASVNGEPVAEGVIVLTEPR
jgi:3-hydroxyacyl-[acyl-carrier-protein] dehydratase